MISPLIHRFFARSGEPMVLNNSFNENEPIVCTISQAQPAHGSERSCTARTDLWTSAIRDQAEEELSLLVPHESCGSLVSSPYLAMASALHQPAIKLVGSNGIAGRV